MGQDPGVQYLVVVLPRSSQTCILLIQRANWTSAWATVFPCLFTCLKLECTVHTYILAITWLQVIGFA